MPARKAINNSEENRYLARLGRLGSSDLNRFRLPSLLNSKGRTAGKASEKIAEPQQPTNLAELSRKTGLVIRVRERPQPRRRSERARAKAP